MSPWNVKFNVLVVSPAFLHFKTGTQQYLHYCLAANIDNVALLSWTNSLTRTSTADKYMLM